MVDAGAHAHELPTDVVARAAVVLVDDGPRGRGAVLIVEALAAGQVHTRFSADGSIHLRQKRSGHLEHGNAPHKNRGQEPGHIVDDSAATRHYHAGAVRAQMHHLFGKGLYRRETLPVFTSREVNNFVRTACQARRDCHPKMAPYLAGGNDEDLSRIGRDELP